MKPLGINMRITTDSRQGGRKYMEDELTVEHKRYPENDGLKHEIAYLAVFDGHGGPDAAKYAKQYLLDEVTNNRNFWSDDDDCVQQAIRDGFLACHKLMWKDVVNWPKTATGLPSTSGTTVSAIFIKDGKLFCAHVGDSSVVLGLNKDDDDTYRAELLTEDHKPESAKEKKRIEESGGHVMAKHGVQRVVWNRPRLFHQGPVRRSTQIDQIPFLAVARSLGDLWSYCNDTKEFSVSPDPDIYVTKLDYEQHKCLVIASDGLWNMVRPDEAIDFVHEIEQQNREMACVSGYTKRKPASELVDLALSRWSKRFMRADNTTVIVAMLDPPGLQRRRTSLSTASTLSSADTALLDEVEQLNDENNIRRRASPLKRQSACGSSPRKRFILESNQQPEVLQEASNAAADDVRTSPFSSIKTPTKLVAMDSSRTSLTPSLASCSFNTRAKVAAAAAEGHLSPAKRPCMPCSSAAALSPKSPVRSASPRDQFPAVEACPDLRGGLLMGESSPPLPLFAASLPVRTDTPERAAKRVVAKGRCHKRRPKAKVISTSLAAAYVKGLRGSSLRVRARSLVPVQHTRHPSHTLRCRKRRKSH